MPALSLTEGDITRETRLAQVGQPLHFRDDNGRTTDATGVVQIDRL